MIAGWKPLRDAQRKIRAYVNAAGRIVLVHHKTEMRMSGRGGYPSVWHEVVVTYQPIGSAHRFTSLRAIAEVGA